MTTASDISAHYSSGELLARLEAMLREDGLDPARPTFEALAPYHHFHGRGLEATEDMADRRATWPGASAAGSAAST